MVKTEIIVAAVGFVKDLELIEVVAENHLNILRDGDGSSYIDASPTGGIVMWHTAWS